MAAGPPGDDEPMGISADILAAITTTVMAQVGDSMQQLGFAPEQEAAFATSLHDRGLQVPQQRAAQHKRGPEYHDQAQGGDVGGQPMHLDARQRQPWTPVGEQSHNSLCHVAEAASAMGVPTSGQA